MIGGNINFFFTEKDVFTIRFLNTLLITKVCKIPFLTTMKCSIYALSFLYHSFKVPKAHNYEQLYNFDFQFIFSFMCNRFFVCLFICCWVVFLLLRKYS